MAAIVAVFLALVLVLTVLVRAGAVWMGRLAGRGTRRRFEEAEHILETRRPPGSWLVAAGELAGRRRRTDLLRRLDSLVEFFRTSPVVADEPTRVLLLKRLSDVRSRWRDDATPGSLPGGA